MKRALVLVIFSFFSCAIAFGADDWGPAQFLIGHWTGDGAGQPGQGTGSFSFTPDLQGKVLVRKSFAAYPAANGKPASRHDDLMIVYRDGPSRELRAMYFDSEEHVIPYAVKPADGGGVVFVTEGSSTTMRYRLTYTGTATDALKLKFEIAPPGKEFATYLEATAHRDRALLSEPRP
jgi:hypothetical protein